MNDFKTTLDRMLKASGKSLNQVAEDGRIDRAYLFRLYHGEKANPSPETVLKIWIGIIFDRRMLAKDLTLLDGLAELSGSVSMTMGSQKLLDTASRPWWGEAAK